MKNHSQIVCLKRKDIDVAAYDLCIQNAHNSMPYAFSYYLDALCEDWQVLMFDNYSAVMPLPLKKKYGIKYVYQPFFVQQLGLFSSQVISEQQLNLFLNSIPSDIKYIETNVNYACPAIVSSIWRKNLVLPLNDAYEIICKKYSSNLQRNLKSAKQNESLLYEESQDIDQFMVMLQNYTLEKSKEIRSSDVDKLKELLRQLQSKKMIKIFLIRNENAWLSASVFLFSNQRMINLLMSNHHEAKQTNSSALLIDRLIEQYANSNFLLDFEGSEIPGVARFYQQFGSIEQNYQRVSFNKLPALLKWLK